MEKSEKVMGRGKELAKNTLIITMGKICTQFVSFLLLPIYTSFLSTNEYGVVDLVGTYQQLLVYVIALQIEQSVFRFLIDTRKKEEDTSRVISSSFMFALIQSIFLFLLYLILRRWIVLQYLGCLVLNIILCVWTGLLLQCARGLGQNVIYTMGSFVSAITTILANIIFIVGFNAGAGGMLMGTAVGSLCCIFFLGFKCRIYKYCSYKYFDIITLKELLRYSVPLVPNALSWWIVSASDRTIVTSVLGIGANGLISVANKFSSILATVNSIFNLSWTESATVHFNDEDRDTFLSNTIQTTLIIFLSFCIGLISVMALVFDILVAEEYQDAFFQVPLYIIAAYLNSIQGLYSVIYVALKKTNEIAKSTMIAAAINIMVNLVLIRYVGLYAATISSIIAYLVICVYRYFDVQKYVNVKIKKRVLMLIVSLICITCISYYSRILLLQIVNLFVVIIVALMMNKKILLEIISQIRSKY